MNNLIDSFPAGFTPTQEQQQAIGQIEKAFETKKFVICCAPTGSGKSMLAKTLSNKSKDYTPRFKELVSSYMIYETNMGSFVYEDECMDMPHAGSGILTVTKSLQDQYERLFTDSAVLKGKNNYQCKVDENFTVDVAPCLYIDKLKEECWNCDKCTYYNARNEAVVSKAGVYNYKMFMCLPDHIKRKEYLICDEAAELEDELVKSFTIDLKSKTLKYLLPDFKLDFDVDNNTQVRVYLNQLVVELKELVESLESKLTKKSKGKPNQTELSKLIAAKNLYGQVKQVLEYWGKCEFVVEDNKTGVTISPLRVDKLSHVLFDHAEKVLLMSATIIDPASFAKSLGITDYEYIEIPSAFDPKHAPIYVMSKYRMNNSNWETLMPTFKNIVEKIVNTHKGQKGIIHTHNMNITKYLKEHLKGDRYLVREQGVDNEQILESHIFGKSDTVLVSPSMTHGVDLKDELARFQILIKAPFLPLNNKRIKKLFNSDSEWYVNKMLTTVMQATGRGVRSKTDHCITYILDGNIANSIVDNVHKLPKYFLKRFV